MNFIAIRRTDRTTVLLTMPGTSGKGPDRLEDRRWPEVIPQEGMGTEKFLRRRQGLWYVKTRLG